MMEDLKSDFDDQFESEDLNEEILWKRLVRERWVKHKYTILAE